MKVNEIPRKTSVVMKIMIDFLAFSDAVIF